MYQHPIPSFADRRESMTRSCMKLCGSALQCPPHCACKWGVHLPDLLWSVLSVQKDKHCLCSCWATAHSRPVALVTIWRTLDCLYLLTFTTKSFPPNTKVLITDRETWWLQGREMRACNLEFPSQLIMIMLQLLKVTRLHLLCGCLLLIKENAYPLRTQE